MGGVQSPMDFSVDSPSEWQQLFGAVKAVRVCIVVMSIDGMHTCRQLGEVSGCCQMLKPSGELSKLQLDWTAGMMSDHQDCPSCVIEGLHDRLQLHQDT